MRIWDTATNDCIKVLEGHEGTVVSLALSKDGRRIVSGSSDKTVRIWDLENYRCLEVLQVGLDVLFVSFTLDELSLVIQFEKEWQIFDIRSLECIKAIPIYGWDFNSNGKIVVSSVSEKKLGIWEARNGALIHYIEYKEVVTAISIGNKYIISGHINGRLCVWDIQSGKCVQVIQGENSDMSLHELSIVSLATDSDEQKIFSVAGIGVLRIWNIQTGECLKTFQSEGEVVGAIAVSCDGALLVTASSQKTLSIWDVRYGCYFSVQQAHRNRISEISASEDWRRIGSGGLDRKVRVWDSLTAECLDIYDRKISHGGISLGLDGQHLVSAGPRPLVLVWDTQSGKCVKGLKGHDKEVTSVVFSSDSTKIISGSADRTIRIWDAVSGECLNSLIGHEGSVTCLKTSKNGSQIISCSTDKTIRIWDVASGKCFKVLRGHERNVNSIALSDDGHQLVSGSMDKTLRIWDTQRATVVKVLHGHEDSVCYVGLSIDRRTIVSASVDNTLRIWDALSGKCISIFYVRGLSCAEADTFIKRIVSGLRDGRVDFYELENLK